VRGRCDTRGDEYRRNGALVFVAQFFAMS